MKTSIIIIVLIIPLLNFSCQSIQSQSKTTENSEVLDKTTKSTEKWLQEKALLSKMMDKIEVNLNNEYSEWKTGTKYTRIPPEYGASHTYSYLSGKSLTNKTAVVQIDLTDFAASRYHTGLDVLGRGSVTPLPSIGDEAVSIRDPYDSIGQVRFVKGNYYVVIYASRPKYAEEIALLVEKQIDEVKKQVNETEN